MKFEIYQGGREGNEQWYWRARAKNGRIMADGAEGYYNKGNARRAAHRFIRLMGGEPSVVS